MAPAHLGLVKTSFIDYPGKVAAVLFTHGCNLRCPYCHNPECVLGSPPGDFLLLEEVRTFMEKRKSILGGVCITGGEPFLHADLPELTELIHSMGLEVKVDTNGTFPDRLEAVRADFIDMDIKTAPPHYGRLMGKDGADTGQVEGVSKAIEASVAWIKQSKIPHRFRITAAPGIVDRDDICSIADLLGPGEHCLISGFSPSVTLDPSWKNVQPYPDERLDEFAALLREKGLAVDVRYNHTTKQGKSTEIIA